MATLQKPKELSMQVDLGKETPAIASVSEFRGQYYLSLRYTYEDRAGNLQMAKNGVNVPIEFGIDAIQALIFAYNDATGAELSLQE